jgi:hypothetical protein
MSFTGSLVCHAPLCATISVAPKPVVRTSTLALLLPGSITTVAG